MQARPLAACVAVALLFAAQPGSAEDSVVAPMLPACAPVPTCPDVALVTGPRAEFRRAKSTLVATLGSPHHRARDLFQRDGTPQWLVAKFVYGKLHKDLEGEDVDVWVLRGCAGTWEKLATVRTHEDEDGQAPNPDTLPGNGRAAFQVPKDKALGLGLHRVRFVVKGDGSTVDALAEIVAPSTRFFVSDVDGTLTSAEHAELGSLVLGVVPNTHRDAPRVLSTLARKGYRPLYLSARAEALTQRTHEFLAYRGFPVGAVRVSNSDLGLIGDDAAAFKGAELARLVAQGLVPSFGFGNRPSDTIAYEKARIMPPGHRFFLGVTDAQERGGRRFDSYTDLLPEVMALPCP